MATDSPPTPADTPVSLTPLETLKLSSADTTGQTDLSHTPVTTSPTSHFLSLLTSGFIDDERTIIADKTLTRAEKQEKVTQLFSRACANGQVPRVKQLWDSVGPEFIDLNAKDEDGTTPLINAACFGHSDVADYLLTIGCEVDAQDKFGWTALMWATNNHHDSLVRLLLDNGANSATKSAGGKTAMDMVQHGYQQDNGQSQKVYDLICQSEQHSSAGTPQRRTEGSSEGFTNALYVRLGAVAPSNSALSSGGLFSPVGEGPSTLSPPSFFSPPRTNGPGEAGTGRQRTSFSNGRPGGADGEQGDTISRKTTRSNSLMEDTGSITNEGYYRGPGLTRRRSGEGEFDWDQCLPDQMYVLSRSALPRFLEAVIRDMSPSLRLRSNPHEKFIPANLLFLAARYAFYFSTPDFLTDFFDQVFLELAQLIKRHHADSEVLAFWLANCNLLLYYLKKDSGLVVACAAEQGRLAELTHEAYQAFVRSVEKQLDQLVQPAIMEHEAIPELFAALKYEPRPTSRFGIPLTSLQQTTPKSQKRRSFFGFGRNSAETITPELPGLRRSASLAARRSGIRASQLFPVSTPSAALGRSTPQMMGGQLPGVAAGSKSESLGPRHINHLLSATLGVIKSCGLHPSFAFSALCQLFYHIGAEVFNMLMLTPNYCCRARAMMVRMNLTQVEDWTRRHHLPVASLNDKHLGPVIQCLQLLQCFSQLQDLPAFVDLTSKLDRLNPLHYRLVAENYTYEVGEGHVAQDVHEYICKVAGDIEDAQRQATETRKSWAAHEESSRRSFGHSQYLVPVGEEEGGGSPRRNSHTSPIKLTSPSSPQSNTSRRSNSSGDPPMPTTPTSQTSFGITLASTGPRKAFEGSAYDRGGANGPASQPTTPQTTRVFRSHHQLFKPAHLYNNAQSMTDFIDPDYLLPFAIPTPGELESWWLNGGNTYTDEDGQEQPGHPDGIIPIVPEDYLAELDKLIP
ncbi:hypothetical protein H4R33_003377 [Dimargaris cristalligena]|nr:hypothetical protein H4R33_003377 [Dimargaris cristalligena]